MNAVLISAMTLDILQGANRLRTVQPSPTERLREHSLRELVCRAEMVAEIRRGLEETRGRGFGETMDIISRTERRVASSLDELSPHHAATISGILTRGFSALRSKAQDVHDVLSLERKEVHLARRWDVSVDDVKEVIPGVVSVHTVVDGIASYFMGRTSTGAHCRGSAHNIIRLQENERLMKFTMDHEDVHNVWECFLPKSSRVKPESIARLRHAGTYMQAHFLFDTLHEELVAQLDYRMQAGFKMSCRRDEIAKRYSTAGRNFIRYLDALDEFGPSERLVSEAALGLFNETNQVLKRMTDACGRLGGDAPLFLWSACVVLRPSQYRHLPAVLEHRFGEQGRLAVLRTNLVG